jgi:alkyl sulfatase BDS1-like metallo-beta-lactamase superfamily hydrolase
VAECLQNGGLKVEGDGGVLVDLFAMLDDFPLMFDILTPAPYPR